MPTLPTHRTLTGIKPMIIGDGPAIPFERGDNAFDVRGKLNTNFGYIDDFVEVMQADVEDISAAVFGRSIINGMEPSIGSGLAIDHTEGRALIGFVIDKESGSIDVLANADPGYIFLRQDGEFEVNLDGEPPELSSFEYCRYTSDSTDVLSIDESNRFPSQILPTKLRLISGSVTVDAYTESSTIHVVDHSGNIVVPGFKTVVSTNNDFDAAITQSDIDEPNKFRFMLTYNGTYEYEYGPISVTVNYTRTGLAFEE